MRKFTFKLKLLASSLALAFVFQSMESINSHSYTTGVDSCHYDCGCFGCYPTHLAVKCNNNNYTHNW